MENLFKGIFKGKTVFVTGHTGFKGSWLTLWLTALGSKVVGYSLSPPTQPNFFEEARLDTDIVHIIGDVVDYEHLSSALKSHEPDIVFHLAAQALVRPSYQSPRSTLVTNITGTINILEAVRNTPSVKVFIGITSDKCYKIQKNFKKYFPHRETYPMGGLDPYSASKGCAELVIGAYEASFFNSPGHLRAPCAVVSARAGNVIGGGDWASDRIMHDCIRALVEKKPIRVRKPDFVRPWQFVLEPLSAYLMLAAHYWDKQEYYDYGWNFGPDISSNISVRDVVKRLIKLMGRGEYFECTKEDSGDDFFETELLKLDCTKAKELLGWSPIYNLDQALEATAEWYKGFYFQEAFNIREFSLTQIERYVNKGKEKALL